MGSWIIQAISKDTINMMMEPSKKPLNVLIKQLHGNIEVILKNGYEYKGKMIKCDGHMNILLEGANEFKDEQLMTNYGNVLLRGNNILYIVLRRRQTLNRSNFWFSQSHNRRLPLQLTFTLNLRLKKVSTFLRSRSSNSSAFAWSVVTY